MQFGFFNCLHNVTPPYLKCLTHNMRLLEYKYLCCLVYCSFMPPGSPHCFFFHRNRLPCSCWKLSERSDSFAPLPSLYPYALPSYLLITALWFLFYKCLTMYIISGSDSICGQGCLPHILEMLLFCTAGTVSVLFVLFHVIIVLFPVFKEHYSSHLKIT